MYNVYMYIIHVYIVHVFHFSLPLGSITGVKRGRLILRRLVLHQEDLHVAGEPEVGVVRGGVATREEAAGLTGRIATTTVTDSRGTVIIGIEVGPIGGAAAMITMAIVMAGTITMATVTVAGAIPTATVTVAGAIPTATVTVAEAIPMVTVTGVGAIPMVTVTGVGVIHKAMVTEVGTITMAMVTVGGVVTMATITVVVRITMATLIIALITHVAENTSGGGRPSFSGNF